MFSLNNHDLKHIEAPAGLLYDPVFLMYVKKTILQEQKKKTESSQCDVFVFVFFFMVG